MRRGPKRHHTARLHDVEASEAHLEALATHARHETEAQKSILSLDHAHTEDHTSTAILQDLKIEPKRSSWNPSVPPPWPSPHEKHLRPEAKAFSETPNSKLELSKLFLFNRQAKKALEEGLRWLKMA